MEDLTWGQTSAASEQNPAAKAEQKTLGAVKPVAVKAFEAFCEAVAGSIEDGLKRVAPGNPHKIGIAHQIKGVRRRLVDVLEGNFDEKPHRVGVVGGI